MLNTVSTAPSSDKDSALTINNAGIPLYTLPINLFYFREIPLEFSYAMGFPVDDSSVHVRLRNARARTDGEAQPSRGGFDGASETHSLLSKWKQDEEEERQQLHVKLSTGEGVHRSKTSQMINKMRERAVQDNLQFDLHLDLGEVMNGAPFTGTTSDRHSAYLFETIHQNGQRESKSKR